MNKHLTKYLTHESESLRNWVKERIHKTDQVYEVIERECRFIPKENQYVCSDVTVTKRGLKSLGVKIIYCEVLNCWDNQLTHLPGLPVCEALYCGNNQLVSLPDLPKCEELDCTNNKLKSLPELPVCLWLTCDRNPGYPFK